ncbi:hypothetical protein [Sphingobacterium detergens]|uniref:Uncharacterized protein n=1 Tax=Sphingobacterium detergens TaxID=1145106 RepID=A0A420ARR8_SPHD1|nr:hypothetical protein [Sphingobacterium detergens]RKE47162.1 hypothetical protein DFQ12_4324 [Sphingobacterium detergens]
MKKLILSLFLLALTTAAIAKTEAPLKTEGKTQAYPNVYWVVSFDGSNYQLSPTQPPGEPCQGGSEPCKITTKDVQGDMQITPTEVNNTSLATIELTQDF